MTEKQDEIVIFGSTAQKPDGPLCVDLFAGAGGLAEGFRQAGWGIAAGNDADESAGKTFRLNFPEASFFQGSVASLLSSDLLKRCDLQAGELDCLIGGPPCQSFSYNNHHRSADNERARLFSSYLDIVSAIRPKTLVMENVPGILTIGNGKVIDEIKTTLQAFGYNSAIGVLSAEEFGTPQIRRRVFIVASRVGPAADLLPKPTHRSAKGAFKSDSLLPEPITVGNAIGDLPSIENGGGALEANYGGTLATTAFQQYARSGSDKLYNHVCHKLTHVNLNRMIHVPEGGNWRDIPFELLTAGMKRARKSDHTKRYGRLSRNGLASTLLTKCDPHWGAYVHPTTLRTISVREAARLQGFPDTFRFAGDQIGAHYEQVGNAVPVPVARAIGACVAAHLATHNEQEFLAVAE